MKRISLFHAAPLALLLASCNEVIVEPVGEPYRITLRATQPALTSGEVDLAALVDYGPFGGVPATVEFLNGSTILAQTSERVALTATAQEPWDYKFQRRVVLQPGADYNLSARIRWTSRGTEKTLTSEVVKFRLSAP